MTTDIVDTKAYKAYETRMERWRSGRQTAKEKLADGWWALYEIQRDELYRKAHGYTKREWVKELSIHEGISNGDFYRVMTMIEAFVANELPEALIRDTLGEQMTALKVDLAEAFGKNGKLLPTVKARIEEQHGSLAKLVANVVQQPKGAARQTVNGLLGKDAIFPLDDQVHFNPQRGELLANVRWDDDGGLVGIYTVKITVTNITEGVEVKDRKHFPDKLARWVGGKLGVQV